MLNLFNKTKTMSLTQYFEVRKPTYVYLKLTPDKSIRNYNSSNIAKAISHMYKDITKRISKEERKFIIETEVKCSYMIDIYKTNVEFYFIVPQQYKSIAIEKIRETWNKCTIEEIASIKQFSQDALKYQLNYKKEDALSLNIDRTNNEPLNSILNVMDIMKEDDRVAIFYNFAHYSDYVWKNNYTKTMQKIKEKKPIDKEKNSLGYVIKSAVNILTGIIEVILDVLVDFTGGKKNDEHLNLLESVSDALNINNVTQLSAHTKKKKESIVLKSQILIASESLDSIRKENNALAVCQGYRSIEDDNSLTYKKVNNKVNITFEDYKIKGIKDNKVSIEECQNFIQLPGRTLLEQHKITHINTSESEVPQELKIGMKCIGMNTYKGKDTKVHLTADKDYKNLAVAIVGPTRSGKTSLLGNLSKDSIEANECVIVLDYIENCSLSEEIKACIPSNKVLEINLHDYTKLQGLGYNEAIKETNEPFLIYESAKQQASQVATLINSLNIEGSEFTPKMERYLNAACLVVFVSKGAIKDVMMLLQDHNTRNKFIKSIPEELSDYLEEYVIYLKELDEWSKPTKDGISEVVGTKTTNIVGILDRFSKLKSNTYMEMMLKKGIENNINLYEEMEKNQCIFIKMPESMFSTPQERDVMTTYWLTKIWIAGQVRAWKMPNRYDRKTVTVITDEIAQLESAEKYLGSKLDQTAKFGIKFILSTMYINQLRIKEKLRTANTSYIFISGADKQNFKELKEEFTEKGFELEDMQKLKRFHALNYIKYEQGYWAGITKLPPPI